MQTNKKLTTPRSFRNAETSSDNPKKGYIIKQIRIEAVGIVLCKTVLQKLTQKKNLEMLFGK